jgi:hypothetical protein
LFRAPLILNLTFLLYETFVTHLNAPFLKCIFYQLYGLFKGRLYTQEAFFNQEKATLFVLFVCMRCCRLISFDVVVYNQSGRNYHR